MGKNYKLFLKACFAKTEVFFSTLFMISTTKYNQKLMKYKKVKAKIFLNMISWIVENI